jgi:hypothetical protein
MRKEIRVTEASANVVCTNPLRSSEPHLVLVPLSGLGLSILCICIFFGRLPFLWRCEVMMHV